MLCPGCAAKQVIYLDIVVSEKVALAMRFPAGSEGRAAYSAAKSALVEELVAKAYAAWAAGAS